MGERCFFNINSPDGGVPRQLAPGLSTTIFPGEHAMLSIVRLDPGAKGERHHHPEEQWGYCVEGSGTRFQGEEAVPVAVGDFWRTPGGVPHTMEAGPEGMVVIDIFAPPRAAYAKPGSGFAGS